MTVDLSEREVTDIIEALAESIEHVSLNFPEQHDLVARWDVLNDKFIKILKEDQP